MKNLKENKSNQAILALLFAAFIFGTVGIFDRTLSEITSSYIQVFVREALSVFIYVIIIAIARPKLITPARKDIKYFVSIGIASFFGIFCFIEAVTRLQIGFSLFIFYTAVLVSGFSYGTFILKEKVNKFELFALGLSLFGLTFMFANGVETINLVGVFFAFVSGCGFSLNLAISKQVSGKYSVHQISIISASVVLVLSIPVMLINEGTNIDFDFGAKGWGIFTLYVILVIIAYYSSLFGYKYLEAQKASIIMLAEIIFATIIAIFVYSEIPTLATLIGGTLVILAQVIVSTKGDSPPAPLSRKRGE